MPDVLSPLELINLYYSSGQHTGRPESPLWRKMNGFLSWENILKRGYQSDLTPLLYFVIFKFLPECGHGPAEIDLFRKKVVPEEIHRKIKKNYRYNLTRNFILLEAVSEIKAAFSRLNISLIPLKGASLAPVYYENIACRPMSDIDLLIEKRDRDRAFVVLSEMGYQSLPESRQDAELHRGFSKEVFGHRIIMELHYRLAKDVFPVDFPLKWFFSLGYIPVESQLPYLAWHAVRHGVHRLIWLCDMAAIISACRNKINWAGIRENSLASNAYKEICFCLHLVSVLVYPLSFDPGEFQLNYATRHISDRLFVAHQNDLLLNESGKRPRYFLSMLLMNEKNLSNFFFRYMRFRQLK